MQKWISVDDRLPKHEDSVMFWNDELSCCIIGFYCSESETFNDESGWGLEFVTHWMPLPEAPCNPT